MQVLSVQAIGQGAYKYGLPSEAQGKENLREQSGLSEEALSKLEATGVLDGVYGQMRLYHDLLNTIDADDGKEVFMRLVSAHRGFIDGASTLSSVCRKQKICGAGAGPRSAFGYEGLELFGHDTNWRRNSNTRLPWRTALAENPGGRRRDGAIFEGAT